MPDSRDIPAILTIFKLYEQQEYMYRSKVHAVPDQIYRTRDNRAYCKKHGIRLSGPKLGRPSPNAQTDKKQEYKAQMRLDNTDRIEVERYFSRSKRCYGLGCIVTKLEETQLTSIALFAFVSNIYIFREFL